MSFSIATAVSGTGTVSCTGTTTVTGVGTNFGSIGATCRVGGTITVAGVTKTITAIASTTSLTTDTAFGTFSGSAYTLTYQIVQSGTDTLNNSTAAFAGSTITDRGGLYRIFDVGSFDLKITGTLTVDSTTAQLRNNFVNGAFLVLSGAASAEFIVTGDKAAANNGPFPYVGFDWLGTNGSKIMQLQGTASFPAKLTLIDACIRFGADWITTNLGQYSTITTSGKICWILCASGTGTSQARLRQDNITASINFIATKTYLGVWLNFGVAQTSLTGYTPIYTDGPEVNSGSVAIAPLITVTNYDTTYVTPAYYGGAQWTNLGGSISKLQNNLVGTNMAWYSQSVSGSTYNVLEFSKVITAKAQDSLGNLLSGGYLYYQPVGSNVAGVRSKGATSDITFDLTQQAIQFSSGSATNEFVYAWAYSNTVGLIANTSTKYFCTDTTKGAETQTVYSSTYGYDKQSSLVTLSGNNATTPTFVHASLPTTDKIVANAAAITGVTFNFQTRTLTVTGNLTVQQIYDAYQYQLNQTANLQISDECTVANGQTYYVGWTIVNSGTISAGTNLKTIRAAFINNSGLITALFTFALGTSAQLVYSNLTSSTIWTTDNTGETYNLQLNLTGSYTDYIPPPITGSWGWVAERYGYQRTSGTFSPSTGGTFSAAPIWIADTAITVTNVATVAAYTTFGTLDQLYDYAKYFETQRPQYVLATKNGSTLDFGALNIIIDATASSVWSYAYPSGTLFVDYILQATGVLQTSSILGLSVNSPTLTIKASVLAAGSTFTTIKTTGSITFANAATATCVYETSVGSSTNIVFGNL